MMSRLPTAVLVLTACSLSLHAEADPAVVVGIRDSWTFLASGAAKSTGETLVAGSTLGAAHRQYDALVVPLSASGEVGSVLRIGGPENEQVASVIALPQGWLLVGESGPDVNDHSSMRPWIVALGEDLGVTGDWSIDPGCSVEGVPHAAEAAGAGAFIAALTSPGDARVAWLARIDAGGDIAWERQYDSRMYQILDAAGTPDGGAVVLYWVQDRQHVATGLLEVDAAGNATRARMLRRGAAHAQSHAVEVAADGDFVVLGGRRCVQDCADPEPAWCVRVDAQGIVATDLAATDGMAAQAGILVDAVEHPDGTWTAAGYDGSSGTEARLARLSASGRFESVEAVDEDHEAYMGGLLSGAGGIWALGASERWAPRAEGLLVRLEGPPARRWDCVSRSGLLLTHPAGDFELVELPIPATLPHASIVTARAHASEAVHPPPRVGCRPMGPPPGRPMGPRQPPGRGRPPRP